MLYVVSALTCDLLRLVIVWIGYPFISTSVHVQVLPRGERFVSKKSAHVVNAKVCRKCHRKEIYRVYMQRQGTWYRHDMQPSEVGKIRILNVKVISSVITLTPDPHFEEQDNR